MTISRSFPLYTVSKKWQYSILSLLGLFGVFFVTMFFSSDSATSLVTSHSIFEMSFDKFSLFLGSVFCVSLFMGLYPLRDSNELAPSFVYYILGGLGIILSNNLLTFFVFWSFQRALPCIHFIRNMKSDHTSSGGTFLIQHFLTFI